LVEISSDDAEMMQVVGFHQIEKAALGFPQDDALKHYLVDEAGGNLFARQVAQTSTDDGTVHVVENH